MSRELIITVRPRTVDETMPDLYGHGANAVIGELVERMKLGEKLTADARVENIHVHDAEGKHIGFNFYLVDGEAPYIGGPRVEVEGAPEAPATA